jgi:hypothetical protein
LASASGAELGKSPGTDEGNGDGRCAIGVTAGPGAVIGRGDPAAAARGGCFDLAGRRLVFASRRLVIAKRLGFAALRAGFRFAVRALAASLRLRAGARVFARFFVAPARVDLRFLAMAASDR